ncbi:MAG: 50S ribosomal protein L31 [Actinomycetales bacterium]|nr:MAG: 50S ribosomal protein L31 [Actinomycetales bacterium]
MKTNTHPTYGPVAFRDRSTGTITVTRSTLVGRLEEGSATVEVDGATLPVLDVDVTSASHPFWTGRGRVVDSEGQVEAFRRRYGKR